MPAFAYLWLRETSSIRQRGLSRRAGLRESFGLIPHLTVGDCPEGGLGVLRAAEAEVLAALPVRTHVSRAWLMTGTQVPAAGSWQLLATFPLGI